MENLISREEFLETSLEIIEKGKLRAAGFGKLGEIIEGLKQLRGENPGEELLRAERMIKDSVTDWMLCIRGVEIAIDGEKQSIAAALENGDTEYAKSKTSEFETLLFLANVKLQLSKQTYEEALTLLGLLSEREKIADANV